MTILMWVEGPPTIPMASVWHFMALGGSLLSSNSHVAKLQGLGFESQSKRFGPGGQKGEVGP